MVEFRHQLGQLARGTHHGLELDIRQKDGHGLLDGGCVHLAEHGGLGALPPIVDQGLPHDLPLLSVFSLVVGLHGQHVLKAELGALCEGEGADIGRELLDLKHDIPRILDFHDDAEEVEESSRADGVVRAVGQNLLAGQLVHLVLAGFVVGEL